MCCVAFGPIYCGLKMEKKIAVIMFGAPGCGKGTQGRLLEQHTNYNFYVMSDLLREAGYKVDLGELLPDEIVFGTFKEKFDTSSSAIIDGIPRTPTQAHLVYNFLVENSFTIIFVYLKVKKEELKRRIKIRAFEERRGDDDYDIFMKRVENFELTKEDILNVYLNNKMEICGGGETDEIKKNILKALTKFL